MFKPARSSDKSIFAPFFVPAVWGEWINERMIKIIIMTTPTTMIRGVYSQEFVANGVEKSWSRSYKIIFLVILHIQIKEFNYRLLIMLK